MCSPRVCNVFATCLSRVSPFWPMLGVRHVSATCLPRVRHVSASVFPFWPTPRVCNVFATCYLLLAPTTCSPRVYHVFSPSGPCCVFTMCSPHVCNMFATCFPLLAHATCLGNLIKHGPEGENT